MNQPSARPLTLRDTMILVAAVAVSFWLCRLLFELHHNPFVMMRSRFSPRLIILVSSTYPALVVSTVTILALRLLKPLPRSWRLRRQPGLIASLSALLMVLIQSLFYWSSGSLDFGSIFERQQFFLTICGPYNIAPGVAIAWSVQWVVGAWRPERSWVDRLGRGMGCLWLAYYVIILAIRYFK